MRITKTVIKDEEKKLNSITNNVNLKVGRRYDYYAIDVLSKDGHVLDTLEAGLTAREAFFILEGVRKILELENKRV